MHTMWHAWIKAWASEGVSFSISLPVCWQYAWVVLQESSAKQNTHQSAHLCNIIWRIITHTNGCWHLACVLLFVHTVTEYKIFLTSVCDLLLTVRTSCRMYLIYRLHGKLEGLSATDLQEITVPALIMKSHHPNFKIDNYETHNCKNW